MNHLIHHLAEMLSERGLNFRTTKSSIVVPATSTSGFDVGLIEERDEEYVVYCGGWHEHLQQEHALRFFWAGLSPLCRLQVYCRGNFEYAWTLQFFENDKWQDQGTTGLFIFPFWRRRQIRYFSNGGADPAQPNDSV